MSSKDHHETAKEAEILVYDNKIKEAATLIANYVGFNMKSDKLRATKYIIERIKEIKQMQGRVSKEALLFTIGNVSEIRLRQKGKFKS